MKQAGTFADVPFFVPVRVCAMCAMFSPHPLVGANQAAFLRFTHNLAPFDLHPISKKNHAHRTHHAQAQPSPVISIDSEVFFVRDVCAMCAMPFVAA
jgi:hypothetical protein